MYSIRGVFARGRRHCGTYCERAEASPQEIPGQDETYSWLLDCKRLESVLERVGEDLWLGELGDSRHSTAPPRAHTTAWRTSSVLLSAPDLADFLPLLELELFFPLCDMASGAEGQTIASWSRRGASVDKGGRKDSWLDPRKVQGDSISALA